MKLCKKCGQNKPLTDFSPTSSYKGVPQRRADCKVCNAANARQWHSENREKSLANSRKWKSENPDKVRAGKWWSEYRIRPEDYNKMLDSQGGKCAICAQDMKKPHIDHCHETGKFRGVLCMDCNTGLGKLGDTAESLQKAADYLKRSSN